MKVQRTVGAEVERHHRRAQDICGLLLFFVGAAGLFSLVLNRPEPAPSFTNEMLRQLAGQGAYVIPILFMFAGTMFLIGYERLSLSHSSLGSLLLFLTYVTWRHITLVPASLPDDVLGPHLKEAGGWIGRLFGEPMRSLLSPPISHLFLITMTLISVVLLVDQPFIEIVKWAHARGRAGAQGAGRGIGRGAAAGRALLPSRRRDETRTDSGSGARMAVVGADDRSVRAKEVVERALTPAGRGAALAAAAAAATTEATGSTSRLLRMFSLTRSWPNGSTAAADIDDGTADPSALEHDSGARAATGGEPAAVEKRAPRRSRTAASADASTEDVSPFDDGDAAKPARAADQLTFPEFVLPPLSLLKEAPPAVSRRSQAELTDRVKTIEQTLEQFNIGANVVEVASGPSVTRYEIQLAPGIKVSKIVSLADNLAMSLAAIDVRVEAPIPGKSAIGVEVPNTTPVMVALRECLDTDEYRNAASKLTVALGKDVSGQYKYADLTKMPHLLIGGSTNSGKSVCLNVLIASLVYRSTPRDVRLLMIDPKRVELSLWDGIPHLMHPVVKDVKQAAGVFRAALKEMDRRYDFFAAMGTRNLEGYNQRVPESERLPYIVLIVDELADLMIQQGPEVETSICRLAQLARATGIHLVIATQRPSVDIITGTIKANISSRIAFAVASQVDSRTILDMTGADRLIGRGDMLFMPIDAAKPIRIQGCYLSEQETNALVNYLKDQEKPSYTFSLTESGGSEGSGRQGSQQDDDVDDQFFEQAVRLVANNGQASTSMLQRRFRIGYTRAARMVEMMEERGIVGALNGAKPREILVSKDQVERMFNPAGSLPSVDSYGDEGD